MTDRRGNRVAGGQRVFGVEAIFPATTSQACTPHKTKTRGTITPGTAQFCYIRSGTGWVIFCVEAREGRYTMIGATCTISFGKGTTRTKQTNKKINASFR